ncbi:MAG: hypothetical protein M3164_06040 [Actinomycetota bacterium]|nr:hypothetical protein [Actinomycetota bacterium]
MRARRTLLGVATACGAIVGATAFAWWATSLRPFTTPSLIVTLASGALALFAGSRLRSQRANRDFPAWGYRVWMGLAVALASWELMAFMQQPRSNHPTLSSIANEILDSHPLRTAAFLVWLATGVDLARR